MWEAPRETPAPKRDPERPSAPSRPVAGREADAEIARAARDALLRLTRGDDRLRGEIEREPLHQRAVGERLAVGVALVGNDNGPIWARALGFIALVFASVNIFGGFLVTQRMLAMYKKKDK